MHSFGVEDHYDSKSLAKGLKSRKNEDEKTFNVSLSLISFIPIDIIIKLLTHCTKCDNINNTYASSVKRVSILQQYLYHERKRVRSMN